MKYRLERTFGPGLKYLHDENGRVRKERLNWANRIHQELLGQTLSINIGPLILNAGGDNSYWLGFVQGMNYSLKSEKQQDEEDSVDLSNCFASTYALLESFDVSVYNIGTFMADSGTIKMFDVGILDPIHLFADWTVVYE